MLTPIRISSRVEKPGLKPVFILYTIRNDG